ncbi:MAG: hypothetical protein ACOC6G_02505, partial [Thermoproteota archaeon]
MGKVKDWMILILVTLVTSVLWFWFAKSRVSFIFSVAKMGYPQNWGYVVLNAAIFGVFAVFLQFRRKVKCLPSSIYLAFIVALFVEMYGFALTWYIMIGVGYTDAVTLWYLLAEITGRELFISIYMGFFLPLSNLVLLAGVLLIIFGWKRVFQSQGELGTTGIYRHVRHPQY